MNDNKATLTVDVDKTKIEGLFASAVTAALSREDAQALMLDAVVKVMEHNYTINNLFQSIASEQIRAYLQSDKSPMRARIKELVDAALEQAFERILTGSEWGEGKLVRTMAEAIAHCLSKA